VWYRVCVGTSPPSTDKPTNGSLPLRVRLWRYRLTWWECWIVGLIAFMLSDITMLRHRQSVIDIVGQPGNPGGSVVVQPGSGTAAAPSPGSARIVFDTFHFGITHTWFANISYLYDISPDWAAPGSADETVIRARLERAVRLEMGIWIPIPAAMWVFEFDQRTPLGGSTFTSPGYPRSSNQRRALPITGQSTFAGIRPVGIFGEICFWVALVLVPLGLSRLFQAMANWKREPPHIRALRKGQCPKCGYSIDRTRQRVCPECGDDLTKYPEIERDDAEPRTRV